MMVRFTTNSLSIHVHYKLKDKNLAMPHMPATGVSGVDLYARDRNHAALRAAYDNLINGGMVNLYYIPCDHLYGDDADGATDGSHASDLGFMRQANVFEPILRSAIEAADADSTRTESE